MKLVFTSLALALALAFISSGAFAAEPVSPKKTVSIPMRRDPQKFALEIASPCLSTPMSKVEMMRTAVRVTDHPECLAGIRKLAALWNHGSEIAVKYMRHKPASLPERAVEGLEGCACVAFSGADAKARAAALH